ncbi:uncharacterized protein LY89DRAFT_675677 [Mollisia scopiformis]|uniref:Uncharacterized protein n=1 Tax=Mollisia scopiformis TaxID=149040 RepID=A0A132BCS1_MOLSC|nr:uncharacterized protein LY89DRAFT_675677 [Mollisia scopiformis]KUJ10196.1 hypothetical protein LY89DRAFT_675677 [Mollisia scopiformis]
MNQYGGCKKCFGSGCWYCAGSLWSGSRRPEIVENMAQSGIEGCRRINTANFTRPLNIQRLIDRDLSPSGSSHSSPSLSFYMPSHLDSSTRPGSSHKRQASSSHLETSKSRSKTSAMDKSSPKPTVKSKNDKEMWKRQASYQTLSTTEKQKQDRWAISQLPMKGRGICSICPDFGWLRDGGSYRCLCGLYFVSDRLLKEGKGGCYMGGKKCKGQTDLPLTGPYYEPHLTINVAGPMGGDWTYKIFGTDNPTKDHVRWS